ncbi:unnamed protein product, partial [Effrenium voratum]
DREEVMQNFKEHGIEGTDVVYLDLSDLQLLCGKVGDRKKILRSLHELKNAKVMQQKNRVIGKFYPWEPWCCCLCENDTSAVIVLPTAIRFKSRPSMRFFSMQACLSRERVMESLPIGQIQDVSVVQRGFGLCDFDLARMFCWSPTAELTVIADNETSHQEVKFFVRWGDAEYVERMLRDAIESEHSGQSDMAYILADKRM